VDDRGATELFVLQVEIQRLGYVLRLEGRQDGVTCSKSGIQGEYCKLGSGRDV